MAGKTALGIPQRRETVTHMHAQVKDNYLNILYINTNYYKYDFVLFGKCQSFLLGTKSDSNDSTMLRR